MSESPATDAAVAAMLADGTSHEEAPQEGQQPEGTDEGQEPISFEDLPQETQDEIRRLRRENATLRVKSREASRSKPTEQQSGEPSTQAIKAAEERGRQAARMENGVRLAGAEVKAALAAVLTEDQIADVVDDLNLSRFVDDDGEVDSEAVRALRDKYISLVGKRSTPRVNHGRQSQVTPTKTTADSFAEAVEAAFS